MVLKSQKIVIFKMTNKKIYLPLAGEKIQAGFPSPATEYEESRIDINDIVMANEASTFFIQVSGNSMIDSLIFPGDILVVDKELEATHLDVVIAVIDGEFTVKTLYCLDGVVKLMPANEEYPEIILENEQELDIWGVVTYTIHKNKRKKPETTNPRVKNKR